jgi:hypothetical protein
VAAAPELHEEVCAAVSLIKLDPLFFRLTKLLHLHNVGVLPGYIAGISDRITEKIKGLVIYD